MSFKGTEYYRDIASFPPNTPPKSGTAYRRYILDLCDHIDEQDKEIEQLKTHLDTYAERIGKRQREISELQKELRQAWERAAIEARRVLKNGSKARKLEQENAELRERIEKLDIAIQQMLYFVRGYGWPRTSEQALKYIEEIGTEALSPKQEGEA